MASLAEAQLLSSLRNWTVDPAILGRFFNTLSYLEHVGSRKILNSAINFTEEHLRHGFEETRHALRFKKMVRTVASDAYPDYNRSSMLGGASPYLYFQRLDAMVRTFLRENAHPDPASLSYSLVTYLVELRAASLYPSIHEIMEHTGIPISLKAIIAEEDNHLKEVYQALMQDEMLSTEALADLVNQEELLFGRLVQGVCLEGDRMLLLDQTAHAVFNN